MHPSRRYRRTVPGFEISVTSRASIDTVFGVVADIGRWHEWAGPTVRESSRERDGHPEPDGVGAVRKLGSRPFYTREEIVEYDRPNHLAYVLRSGLPLRDYRADVLLAEAGDEGTSIIWRSTFEPVIPGSGAAFRWFLRRTVSGFATRLAARAERP